MPTGYTHRVESGISFKEFVTDCAKAFMVEYRDIAFNTPIEKAANMHFDNEYYTKQIDKTTNQLKKYEKMSVAEATKLANAEIVDNTDTYKERILQMKELKHKYDTMLENVREWECPPEFVNLKNFMIEQLTSSISHDCDVEYYEKELKRKKVKINGEKWLKERIKWTKESLTRYKENYRKAIDGFEKKKKWVTDLLDCIEKIK